MLVSEAAEQAGVNVQTIRYYERRGLLPPSARRPSGYRELPAESVRVVRFIKRAQDLGFSLDEVAELLRLRRSRDRVKARAIAGRRLTQIEQKLTELAAMRDALRHLVHTCRDGATPACPILEALEDGVPHAGGHRS
jgi:DNA-binding transcriptional MerR regulator